MPKTKYYNPQEDVVQIKDGKRTPVKAYDLYQGLHAGPGAKTTNSAEKIQEKMHDQAGPLSMRFDGQYLTLIHKEGNKTTEYNFPAVSGQPLEKYGTTFSYDKERQKIKDVGPIPEGQHTVDLSTTQYWKDAGLQERAKAFIGRGNFPGWTRSWGKGHIDIRLDPQVQEKTNRSGMTIHGGTIAGSRGCIDLVNKDEAFFSKLEELKGTQKEIPLTVDYSKTPEKVKWSPRTKPTTEEKQR